MVFCESFSTLSLKVKFSVAWQKSLQVRAKHIPEISSKTPEERKIQFFLSIKLGKEEDKSHSLKKAWRNSSWCSKRLSLSSTVTFLPCFMALFNTHNLMAPGDSSVQALMTKMFIALGRGRQNTSITWIKEFSQLSCFAVCFVCLYQHSLIRVQTMVKWTTFQAKLKTQGLKV